MAQYDVVVVGGGIAGASAVYHLSKLGLKILLVEAGQVGVGVTDETPNPYPKPTPENPAEEPEWEETYQAGVGGTRSTKAVKMMITMFPCKPKEFIDMHGDEGAKLYFKLTQTGLETQKGLARQILNKSQFKELGSLCLATPETIEELQRDYHMLRQYGVQVELWNKEQVEQHHGPAAGFVGGLFFPQDAIIHSAEYARQLLKLAAGAGGKVEVREHCKAVSMKDLPDGKSAVTELANGTKVISKHVVVATGGLFLPPELKPIVHPSWAYFSFIPDRASRTRGLGQGGMPGPDSPSYFTYDFNKDWTMCEGVVRVSGEDHFSGHRPPFASTRCKRLAEWVYEKYPYIPRGPYAESYGVVSFTDDMLPLVGPLRPGSRVVYLLACQAWGQTLLSGAATLIPGVLGYRPFEPVQAALAKFLSPSRPALKHDSKL